MMYISAYPVTILMRHTNVYEEKSLGKYEDEEEEPDTASVESNVRPGMLSRMRTGAASVMKSSQKQHQNTFLREQLRSQLGHDVWFLAVAVFLIMIIEGGQFEKDPVNFSVFNVLFEVVSGYATVGLSLGFPGVAYSFCGRWHVLSK